MRTISFAAEITRNFFRFAAFNSGRPNRRDGAPRFWRDIPIMKKILLPCAFLFALCASLQATPLWINQAGTNSVIADHLTVAAAGIAPLPGDGVEGNGYFS